MNKGLISSAIGIVGTGVSLTGCYALGAFNRSSSTDSSWEPEKWVVNEDVSEFRNQSASYCVTNIFHDVQVIAKAPGYKEKSEAKNEDVGLTFNNEKASKGCVSINWEREGNTGSNYTGHVTFMWAFEQENKGFILYVNLEFEEGGYEKPKAESLIYTLSKEEGENKAWTITSQYEFDEKQKIEINSSQLPKPGTALTTLVNKNKNFWGMEMEDTNTSHLVKEDGLDDNAKKEYRGGSYWEWTGKEGNDALEDWSTNLGDWWKVIFKDSKNNEIVNQVKQIKGSWKEGEFESGK